MTPTRASSSWPRPATFPCAGPVAPASVTPARPDSSTERSSTVPSRSKRRPRATCSCAARDPRPISRSICDLVADAQFAVVEDLGPQATAMHQRSAHAGHAGELLQVDARFREAQAAHAYRPHSELAPHEVVERDALGDEVASGLVFAH